MIFIFNLKIKKLSREIHLKYCIKKNCLKGLSYNLTRNTIASIKWISLINFEMLLPAKIFRPCLSSRLRRCATIVALVYERYFTLEV